MALNSKLLLIKMCLKASSKIIFVLLLISTLTRIIESSCCHLFNFNFDGSHRVKSGTIRYQSEEENTGYQSGLVNRGLEIVFGFEGFPINVNYILKYFFIICKKNFTNVKLVT